MNDPWDDAAIVRQCRRCLNFQSINAFDALAVLCQGCVGTHTDYQAAGANVRARAIVLTEKGRAALAEEVSAA